MPWCAGTRPSGRRTSTRSWPVELGGEAARSAAIAAARIVTAHDLARGALIRVSQWEYLTGVLDSEREQMRAAADEDGW